MPEIQLEQTSTTVVLSPVIRMTEFVPRDNQNL